MKVKGRINGSLGQMLTNGRTGPTGMAAGAVHIKVWAHNHDGMLMVCTTRGDCPLGKSGGADRIQERGWNVLLTAGEVMELAKALLEARATMMTEKRYDTSNSTDEFPESS